MVNGPRGHSVVATATVCPAAATAGATGIGPRRVPEVARAIARRLEGAVATGNARAVASVVATAADRPAATAGATGIGPPAAVVVETVTVRPRVIALVAGNALPAVTGVATATAHPMATAAVMGSARPVVTAAGMAREGRLDHPVARRTSGAVTATRDRLTGIARVLTAVRSAPKAGSADRRRAPPGAGRHRSPLAEQARAAPRRAAAVQRRTARVTGRARALEAVHHALVAVVRMAGPFLLARAVTRAHEVQRPAARGASAMRVVHPSEALHPVAVCSAPRLRRPGSGAG